MESEESREERIKNKRRLDKFVLECEDTFKSPGFVRFFVMPQGHEGVRTRIGKTKGWPYLFIPQDRKFPIPFLTSTIKPGLRFVVGLRGLWGRVATVDMRLRTEDLPVQNVMTEGGVELPNVDATLDYQVVDPVKALVEAEDYRKTTYEFAKKVVTNRVGRLSLSSLENLTAEETNLLFGTDGKVEYDTSHLQKEIGVDLKRVYLTNLDIPDELRRELAQKAILKARGEGEVELSRLQLQAAQYRAEEAKLAADPNYRFVVAKEMMSSLGEKQNVTIITGAGGVLGAIREMLGNSGNQRYESPKPLENPETKEDSE